MRAILGMCAELSVRLAVNLKRCSFYSSTGPEGKTGKASLVGDWRNCENVDSFITFHYHRLIRASWHFPIFSYTVSSLT
jgi:hypothetical protein